MKVTVTINRRPEIADPEGTTVERALHDLGYTEASVCAWTVWFTWMSKETTS